jgi:hypothetical protein
MPEGAARFSKQLAQLFRGALAIGLTREGAAALALRCARDSMPPLRLAILKDVWEHVLTTPTETRKRLDKPYSTIDRQMQAMQLLRVLSLSEDVEETVTQDEQGDEVRKTKTHWRYALADDLDPSVLGIQLPTPEEVPF